jgi:hypothetical protein
MEYGWSWLGRLWRRLSASAPLPESACNFNVKVRVQDNFTAVKDCCHAAVVVVKDDAADDPAGSCIIEVSFNAFVSRLRLRRLSCMPRFGTKSKRLRSPRQREVLGQGM